MPIHSELTAAAVVALVALMCGVAMARLKQSAIVGYIIAGVLLGPSGFALVKDRETINTLAEFGVLMLLFLVGMELHLKRFVEVWRTAVFATVFQIAGSLGVALLLRYVLGWSTGMAVLLGFVVSISSTAVVIKMLESAGELTTPTGRITVGILIAQDMAVVPMMLVLNSLSAKGFSPVVFGKIAFSILFLFLLLFFLIKRTVKLPFGRVIVDNHDLSPLTGLAYCFGAAAVSGLLDLSPAYGAFLAGVTIGNSEERAAMIKSTQPVQAVLLMAFFLSIGLLLDSTFIWKNLGTVMLLLLMVTVFKTALNVGALKLLGQAWPVAFLAGVSLAQIGEFSFLLAATGRANKLITSYEARLVISVTVLSLVLSPFWLMTMRRLHDIAGLGPDSPRELLNAVYGREAEAVSRFARRLLPPPSREDRDAGP
jgi:CPA2 family monovalent cation:H+ antiporter-2